MTPVLVERGDLPVILAFPHTGTHLPDAIHARLNAEGRILRDTDWHLDRLYDGLLPGASVVQATFHRYVVDANRDPSGQSLYPGRNTTDLVPRTNFDGVAIWREGAEPDAAECRERTRRFHAPYHAALAQEIERVRAAHGIAILYDCHSIRSAIPHLFDGVLPDINLGTDGGRTLAPALEKAALHIASEAAGLSHVLNGRFRGGWTTRHYGRPEEGVHAFQMELAQSTHLVSETPPFAYDATRAAPLRAVLAKLLNRFSALAPTLAGGAA
ncbi:N-formylglutamate deformylase [Aureimonas frigidaquae]|uniref:N-formylglutamate amidohydrolase n=1 Tax=Aureimonas frigidaquae TaxID=424757 RepID=A0A0P0Z0R3_9HYPH|nr:N-formylglutamate deformylase [Aureimonas frigidaquae]BAT27530.1 N-formylglutamate amidohydrolase [Aureimonas frigidaquae]